jgi:hypothetical protein
VSINETRTADNLKEAILAKKSIMSANVEADQLTLWKVSSMGRTWPSATSSFFALFLPPFSSHCSFASTHHHPTSRHFRPTLLPQRITIIQRIRGLRGPSTAAPFPPPHQRPCRQWILLILQNHSFCASPWLQAHHSPLGYRPRRRESNSVKRLKGIFGVPTEEHIHVIVLPPPAGE